MFPFPHYAAGILCRPPWSARREGGGDLGSISTPSPKCVYSDVAQQQVGIRRDGQWPYYTTSHRNRNQGWRIVAGKNLKASLWRVNSGKRYGADSDKLCETSCNKVSSSSFYIVLRPVFGPRLPDLPPTFSVPCYRLHVPYLHQIYDIPPNCIPLPASRLSHRPYSSKTSSHYFPGCSTSQELAQCNTKW